VAGSWLGRDDGSGSILAIAGAAVLLLSFAGAVAVGDLVATDTRARTAADLAALAAAGAAAYGPGPACSRAAAVAADNHAQLQRCSVGAGSLGQDATPFDVDVVVAARVAGPAAAVAHHLGLEPPVLRARAVAGPGRVVPAP
jgi:secretion/DNA translocation related TadE-like protein